LCIGNSSAEQSFQREKQTAVDSFATAASRLKEASGLTKIAYRAVNVLKITCLKGVRSALNLAALFFVAKSSREMTAKAHAAVSSSCEFRP
jgi:hypothetical protein